MQNDGSLAGRTVACPMCGTHFVMPPPGATGPAAATGGPELIVPPGSTLPDRAARIHQRSRRGWGTLFVWMGILGVLCCGGFGVFGALIWKNFQVANEMINQNLRNQAAALIATRSEELSQAGFQGLRFEAKEVEWELRMTDVEVPIEPDDQALPAESDNAEAGAEPDTAAPTEVIQVLWQVARVRFVNEHGEYFWVVISRPSDLDPWKIERIEYPEGLPKKQPPKKEPQPQ